MIKYIFLFLLFSISASAQLQRYTIRIDSSLLEVSLKVLLSQVGKYEKGGDNIIEGLKYGKSVGIGYPIPYCAAGQYWCFDTARFQLKYSKDSIPLYPSPLASQLFIYTTDPKRAVGFHKARTIKPIKTKPIPEVNDLIVWKFSDKPFGHIERVISVGKGGWVTTVGFNTSSGNSGDQRNGGGVWIRKRNVLSPLGRMRSFGLLGFRFQ